MKSEDSFFERAAANFMDQNNDGRLTFSEYASRTTEMFRRDLSPVFGRASDELIGQARSITPDAVRASYRSVYETSPGSFPAGIETPSDNQVAAFIDNIDNLAVAARQAGPDGGRLQALARSAGIQRDLVTAASETVIDDAQALAARLVHTAKGRQ